MKSKLTNLTLTLLPLFAIGYWLLAQPTYAQASSWEPKCTQSVVGTQVATIQGITCVVHNLLEVALVLLGIVALLAIFGSAFAMIVSGGNPEKKAVAQQGLTYAILGLGLAIAAWFILQFIAIFAFGAQADNLLDFDITIFSDQRRGPIDNRR